MKTKIELNSNEVIERYPTKWMNRTWQAYEEAGGWMGERTLEALTPRAFELYDLGLNCPAAGNVLANEQRLYHNWVKSRRGLETERERSHYEAGQNRVQPIRVRLTNTAPRRLGR